MTEESKLDPTRCPLCGNLNSCAGQSGASESCWCTSISIPRETLARIPLEAVNRACLCPRCAGLEPALAVDSSELRSR